MKYSLLLLFSYLLGLLFLFPSHWGVGWIRAIIPTTIQWQEMQVDWRGLHGEQIAIPLSTGVMMVPDVAVTPRFLPILWGSPAADYRIRLRGGALHGSLQWQMSGVEVQWQIQVDDFSKFPALFSLPMPMTGRGEGEGEIVLDWPTKNVSSGSWVFAGKEIAALGVMLESLHIKGDVSQENQLVLSLSGKGNIALSGQLKVAVPQGALLDGQLTGQIKIQPLAGRLQGVVAVALRGKPATLIMGGQVRQPSWKIQ